MGEEVNIYDEAKKVIIKHNRASTRLIQRELRIGYSLAAGVMDDLQAAGVVSKPDKLGRWKLKQNNLKHMRI